MSRDLTYGGFDLCFLNRISTSQIYNGSEALAGVLWDLWNLKRTRKLLKY